MRVSCIKTDPGYVPFIRMRERGMMPIVFLNDVEMSRAVTADEEQRTILRHVTDEQGRAMLNEARDAVLDETLYGDVRIEEKAV